MISLAFGAAWSARLKFSADPASIKPFSEMRSGLALSTEKGPNVWTSPNAFSAVLAISVIAKTSRDDGTNYLTHT